MADICTACMCSGRNLYFIGETGFYHLYSQILNEIQVYDMSKLCVRICWECRALLRRMQIFKQQVKKSYSALLQYVQQNSTTQPSPEPPHLQHQQLYNFSYPVLEVKNEIDDTQSPLDDDDRFDCLQTEEMHCEPETFVKNLNLEKKWNKKVAKKVDKNLSNHQPVTKTEVDDTRSLFDDGDRFDCIQTEETHCEPETFVKNLNLEKKWKKKDAKKVHKNLRNPQPVIKTEVDDTRSPFDDGDRFDCIQTEETHCEPETFVKNLNLEKKMKKQEAKKINKAIKEKTKKKVKPKTKKSPVKKKIKVKQKRSISSDSLHVDGIDVIDDVMDVKEAKKEESHEKQEKNEIEDVTIEVPLKETARLNGGVKPLKDMPTKEMLPERPHCVECGKNFSSRKTYRYHLNVLHKGQNRYPCPRCGKVYQWKSNLGRHLRSHKARDSGELYCETCDKRFASVATYRQHLRVSRRHVPESEFSFMCNECGKKFVNKTRLRDHIDWEHLKKIKFRCQLCNKPFKCHTSLYVHMQNVHRNKEKKDNLCHVCGKSYQNAAKLKYHIVAMHTSETPYQCEQCNAAFGWYSSLYRHVREVHYKMKVQPKKSKKSKKAEILPSLLPPPIVLAQMHHAGPP